MTLTEIIFILTGTCAVLFFGGKLVCLFMTLTPKLCYPLPNSFFTSLGKWAVVTGGSDGIGRAYAQEFSKHGMNVVIISRNQEKLDRAARKIELNTGGEVKVIAADFTKDDLYGNIKKNIEGLDIGILVNNVGILPNQIPCKLLETADLEERIHAVINCNVKAMVKMCRIVLPGMQERRGVILNVSSGIAKIPCPIYTLYAASKVFVERFSEGLQAEYKSKGIIIQVQCHTVMFINACCFVLHKTQTNHTQLFNHEMVFHAANSMDIVKYQCPQSGLLFSQTVAPFGVSTSMTGYQKPDMVTFTTEEFVRSSLMYLKAGDQTYGSATHTILGWIVQGIPTWILQSEAFQHHFKEYVKERIGS
ncbi:17-beta-hydroxysteroid dehydrogenase type 3 isoform X2 [Myxocyprinus asiaticus]|uniref:17-beta-hydroxysteroid dehydrogenase type 3 isoform X2 n=1 Tax=Myxocyprinus asiaticus TaxID=70543 RepID=UPI002222A760|nr:17-beta-hydroxysteroid dehydrogenase type 3 isoform X2 [Myxocyprinus asiaticus]